MNVVVAATIPGYPLMDIILGWSGMIIATMVFMDIVTEGYSRTSLYIPLCHSIHGCQLL